MTELGPGVHGFSNPHVNGRVVVAEIVQQKKRIKILGLAETEGALKT
jgi:hypothetical protein